MLRRCAAPRAQRDIVRDGNRLIDIENMMGFEIAPQIDALDKFHHNIVVIGALPIVIDLDNIGMRER